MTILGIKDEVRERLAFGLGDLYRAAAGLLGGFPSRLFRYKPADHVVHVVLGLLLAGVGWVGLHQ